MLQTISFFFIVFLLDTPTLALFSHTPNGSPLTSTSFGIPGLNATFDYIVIGGGTAGLALATRLSSSSADISVAVVEAGSFYEITNGNLSVVPGYGPWFTGLDEDDWQPGVDWGFQTVPQTGFSNRTYHYTRGKTLGGSSARNYMLYQRATVDSFTRWATLVDDPSYTWPSVLPYYKKSTRYTPFNASLYTNATNSQSPSSFTPPGSPLPVSFSNHVDAFGTWAQRAFQAHGMAGIAGFNDGALLGSAFGTFTISAATGARASSESSFLAAALARGTAPTVYVNTLAQRILFTTPSSSSSPPRATAVRVSTAGTFGTPSRNYTLRAAREVVVSGGAFQSPQLLLASGVGDCAALRNLSISCIAHLPGVGRGMWDHPAFGTAHRVRLATASAALNNASAAAAGVAAFVRRAAGPLSALGPGVYGWEKLPEPWRAGLSGAARRALDEAAFPEDWPEVEWLPNNVLKGNTSVPVALDPRDGTNFATLSTALIAPLSRGSVGIRSADMEVPPVVDPAWLTHPADREMAVLCVRRQREVWRWLVEQGVAEEEEYYPGDGVRSDEEIYEWLKGSLSTIYHASCTCKMGTRDDAMAVLDGEARVFGLEGVRVVDASSFPILVPGHPQATVYMLAEKIADRILDGLGKAGDGNLSTPVDAGCQQ
ncbi:GMC oxidoreductase [Neofusicoccum parvum]|uniref:GMC oxidoreductase n=1 Tax=Neofusicoccum parvum TaxID=310453 RepID=A0ACB5RPC6_9PEZI|nr:GMC oxidoreductase [Neofusicoccum parvum]